MRRQPVRTVRTGSPLPGSLPLRSVMRTTDTLTTRRLRGERLTTAHLPFLQRMFRNPDVCATLGGTLSDAQIEIALQWNLDHWDRCGYGIWIFFDRDTGDFAGRAGVRQVDLTGRFEIELAYAVMPERWNCGLATEMSREVLRAAFEVLDIPDVLSFTLRTNLASQRVMQKLDFVFERDGEHAGLPHVFYRLTRERFRQ